MARGTAVVASGRSGLVSAFDVERGLGEITGSDGSVLPFHCTAIADGTRVIDVGASVRYEVVAGRSGRWEAATISQCGP